MNMFRWRKSAVVTHRTDTGLCIAQRERAQSDRAHWERSLDPFPQWAFTEELTSVPEY